MALKLKELFAGDSLELEAIHPDYSATDWSHYISLMNIENEFTLEGLDCEFTATSDTTSTWPEGVYQWVWYVKNDTGGRKVLEAGEISIKPDPTKAGEFRTHAQRMIIAIEALMEGKATNDQLSQAHNGKSLTRYSPEEWTKLLKYYKAERAKEKRAEARKSGANTSIVKARFTQG